MSIRDFLTKPVRHSWPGFCLALVLALSALVWVSRLIPRVGHDVSAAAYAGLKFDGLVSSNGARYGAFTITNRHQHPLNFSVNNIQIRTPEGWRSYASWSPGGERTNVILGKLDNLVAPSKTFTFLVRQPDEGDAWRIHVGVLRGVQGLTLQHRVAILWRTGSLPAALTGNPALTKGYHHFTFAGMLDGPDISLNVGPAAPLTGVSPPRSPIAPAPTALPR